MTQGNEDQFRGKLDKDEIISFVSLLPKIDKLTSLDNFLYQLIKEVFSKDIAEKALKSYRYKIVNKKVCSSDEKKEDILKKLLLDSLSENLPE
ncbi:MAG: hypothetical protein N4A44_00330 [Alphaproteobacteria bacterium]|jgi:hypothetical protein|nr:hypothetical protein [Alphaproteobacteria bacterium]